MHEFSIIQSIVAIAAESASQHHAEHVSVVEIEVGQAAGVVTEALEFAWEAARKGTVLDNASLVIKHIPLRVACGNCHIPYQPVEIYDPCPGCGDINPEIISGKELRVVAIEI
ncbi:MAG TPA: hydrogenase maturation nickel metallochaperone HypA [Bacteroidales bacterium]|nr:hydrogenase maturation nickel metallochaperone HypA [Bacteroidales bacterium]